MRVHLATLLVRLAVRILAGHDDRLVLLNTSRTRSRRDGRIYPFTGWGSQHVAYADSPESVRELRYLGLPVPAIVARLAGWGLSKDEPPDNMGTGSVKLTKIDVRPTSNLKPEDLPPMGGLRQLR